MESSIRYIRGAAIYNYSAKNLVGMIQIEADKDKMLPKSEAELIKTIKNGNSILAFCDKKVVGFVCLLNYKYSVEIVALIVDPYYRGKGIGMNLANHSKHLSKIIYPNKSVLIFANNISVKIAIKLGFIAIDKKTLRAEFLEVCRKCSESANCPDCHCKPMMLM